MLFQSKKQNRDLANTGVDKHEMYELRNCFITWLDSIDIQNVMYFLPLFFWLVCFFCHLKLLSHSENKCCSYLIQQIQ